MTAGGEWLSGLGQTHIHNTLSFANILQKLRKKKKHAEKKKNGG